MPETFSIIFIAIYLVVYMLLLGVSLLAYAFTAYALSKMAKSCGLKRPWMAFLPVAGSVLVGQLADVHCRRNEGKKSSYAKILLWLGVALLAIMAIILILVILLFIVTAAELNADLFADTAPVAVILCTFALFLAYLAMLVVAIILSVFYYIALYKVFKLYTPAESSNAAIFLLLTLLCSFSLPITLMFLARKEPKFPCEDKPTDTDLKAPVFPSEYSL